MNSQCGSTCTSHMFTIKANSNKCWMKNETSITYCPSLNEYQQSMKGSEYRTPMNIVPIFNNDRQPCLPGFILEYDKGQYVHSLNKYQEDHDRKIQEYTAKKKDIYEPRPNKRHRYCGVCKLNYDEYREVFLSFTKLKKHINTREHTDNFNKNSHVKSIRKLSQQFKTSIVDDSPPSTTIVIDNVAPKLNTKPTQAAQKRGPGRPPLSAEQKLKNKLEREERKRRGEEPPPRKKTKQNPPIKADQGVFFLDVGK